MVKEDASVEPTGNWGTDTKIISQVGASEQPVTSAVEEE